MTTMPIEDDDQTRLEVEMAASGRTSARPREGLVGAHAVRRNRRAAPLEGDQHSYDDEPTGTGSLVAPTPLAELRERERHRLQRAQGVVPAGEDGNLRQRRSPRATRSSLDAAARAADQTKALRGFSSASPTTTRGRVERRQRLRARADRRTARR
jgi:hypothetical protein